MKHSLQGRLAKYLGCLDYLERMWLGRWRGLKGGRGLRRRAGIVTTLVVIASVVTTALWPAPTSASWVNVLYNGGFEQGFSSQAGCGMVGSGWQCFTNGGAANYGFYDDQWNLTVAEGSHSQLIELNTKGIMLGDADRYAGIYQTVGVVDWAEYTLSLKGMIRTTNLDGDPWRYRVQVGWSFGPQPDWGAVNNWTDVGWDSYYERTNPGAFLTFSRNLMAEADTLTVYVRVWKKWGVPNEELDLNLDALALMGPSPHYYAHGYAHGERGVEPYAPDYTPVAVEGPAGTGGPLDYPAAPCGQEPHDCGQPAYPVQPLPPAVDYGVCLGPEKVYNGGFELGFNPIALGHVGNSWGFFTNGGGANYGFYDDQWTPVVAEGRHSQLIEINTKGVYPADNDRYAGIYQYIAGLHPGATYEFTLRGLLRGTGNEDDPYRFAAQVGYTGGYVADWGVVQEWTEMNLGPIGVRTEPGRMEEYKLKFTAPAPDMTLFIRGWKKWGITNVEMDFDIDAVSVRACGLYTGGPVPGYEPVVYAPGHKDGHQDGYQAGYGWDQGAGYDQGYEQPPVDQGYGYEQPPVDQGYGYDQLPVDGGYDGSSGDHQGGYGNGHDGSHGGHDGGYGDPGYGTCSYTVAAGDRLDWIAQANGVSTDDLIAVNGIMNPDLIYAGQQLAMPGCAGQADANGAEAGYGDSYGAAAGYGAEAGYGDGAEAPAGYADAAYAGPQQYNQDSYPMAPDGPAYPADGGWADQPAAPGDAPHGQPYTVRAGDTVTQIAAAFGVDDGTLCQVNGIANPNIIYVGQQLVIP